MDLLVRAPFASSAMAMAIPVKRRGEAVFGAALRVGTRRRPMFLATRVRAVCLATSAAPSAVAGISEEEVRQFEEDGAIVVRQLFSSGWVERLRNAAEVNMADPGPLCDEHVPSGQPGRFHDDQFLWMRHDTMREFLYESPAGAIAKRMSRAKEIRLLYDQLFIKEPGTQTTTPWHNDHSYWPLVGDQIVSLWVALDQIPKSACLQYVKGSHKWKLIHKLQSFGKGNEKRYEDANMGSLPDMPDIENRLDEVELLTWDMDPGDCLVHHSFAVHGAPGISKSGNRRRAYATRWVGDNVRFDPRPGMMHYQWHERAGLDAKLSAGSRMESDIFPAVP